MGMYTELVLGLDIKRDAPEQVVAMLDWLFNWDARINNSKPESPDHAFFKCERLLSFGFGDSSSFAGCPASRFLKAQHYYDPHELSIMFNLKNYDNEIELFLDWIHPYVDEEYETFVGYSRYEEDDHPRLIYWAKQGWQYRRPVV